MDGYLNNGKKEILEKAIEVTLWEEANKLRGSLWPAEYMHVVFGLVFLKFASDKFEECRVTLISEGKEKYVERSEFYNMSNVKLSIPDIKIQEANVIIYRTLETRKRINEILKNTIKPLCPVLMKGVVESMKLENVKN